MQAWPWRAPRETSVATRPQLQARYDARFRRMWRYYLLSCAGAFRAREVQLYQLVLGARERSGRYDRPAF